MMREVTHHWVRGFLVPFHSRGRWEVIIVRGKRTVVNREFASFIRANIFARRKIQELGGGVLFTWGKPEGQMSEVVRANEGDARRHRRATTKTRRMR